MYNCTQLNIVNVYVISFELQDTQNMYDSTQLLYPKLTLLKKSLFT